jgi:hypothetical protein
MVRCLYLSVPPITSCAVDAAIWAEQQLVAIPGWLREDQNARLHQEGRLASTKEPRLARQKEKLFAAGDGEQDGDPFGPRPTSFQHSWKSGQRNFQMRRRILGKLAGREFWGNLDIFPKSANSLIILKLMIFQETFITK